MKLLIRKYRKQRGMTQRQLAAKIGKSRPTLTLIELGINRISANDLYKIAQVLNVRIDKLFQPNGDQQPAA